MPLVLGNADQEKLFMALTAEARRLFGSYGCVMAGSENDFFVRITSLANGQELWKCAGTTPHILEAFKRWVASQSI
jgi:hypothetical protein